MVTLNGFPYQSFQAPVVKHAVYHPDWTDPERLDYTLDLARVLADLLPDDAARGSISTLPLAWREPVGRRPRRRRRTACSTSWPPAWPRWRGRPAGRSGSAFEPEPGCVVETTAQAVAALAGVDTDRLGVCLDLAHLACAWEEPAEALGRLRDAGLPVVKVQVSAALEAADPVAAADGAARRTPSRASCTRPAAAPAAPPTDDLDEALRPRRLPGPWRVHYHVPLHADPCRR